MRWTRKVWQAGYRVRIREADIAPTPVSLSGLATHRRWGPQERAGALALDESRDRPAVVLLPSRG